MLEEDIAVFRRAVQHGVLRIERSFAERLDGVHIHHLFEILIIPNLNLLNLMRGAEAVEEVDKRNSTLDGSQMRYGAEIHDLLLIGLCQHGKAGLTTGIHIGMVAENVQRVRCNRTRGNMKYAGQQFARDLIHIRDHQKKALRCGIGGRQRACAQRTVHRTGGTCLGFHFGHLNGRTENIFQPLRRPLVNIVRHRAGRGDGVNARDLGKRIAYMRSRLVPIHG